MEIFGKMLFFRFDVQTRVLYSVVFLQVPEPITHVANEQETWMTLLGNRSKYRLFNR